jgi:hypothetical protein
MNLHPKQIAFDQSDSPHDDIPIVARSIRTRLLKRQPMEWSMTLSNQSQSRLIMADTQDMKNLDEQQNYALANNSDPKNVQELTSYVS